MKNRDLIHIIVRAKRSRLLCDFEEIESRSKSEIKRLVAERVREVERPYHIQVINVTKKTITNIQQD